MPCIDNEYNIILQPILSFYSVNVIVLLYSCSEFYFFMNPERKFVLVLQSIFFLPHWTTPQFKLFLMPLYALNLTIVSLQDRLKSLRIWTCQEERPLRSLLSSLSTPSTSSALINIFSCPHNILAACDSFPS